MEKFLNQKTSGTSGKPERARLAVWALTPDGAALGRRIADSLGGVLHVSSSVAERDGAVADNAQVFESLGEALAQEFRASDGHVLICAAGIAVRLLAPLLVDKQHDPAVVVCDQAGRHAVSLVSGHLGGANALAREVAGVTGSEAVITTATDTAGLPAVDVLAAAAGLAITDIAGVRAVSAALLTGSRPQLYDPENRLGLDADHGDFFERVDSPEGLAAPAVAVDWRIQPTYAAEGVLHLAPPVVCVGVGCRRGTMAQTLDAALQRFLTDNAIAPGAVRGLASIDAKADEAGIIETARRRDLSFTTYPARELNRMTVPNPSKCVCRHMGVESVCEAAAKLLANEGQLVAHKTVWNGVTLAAAVLK
ncbi:cobalt-precorrin 5A hydrolase [Oceanidesulfovibrio marinus]|uniref:Cobalamin biosynthesis protein CbiG n=1 Tax=Oceanidesulfovibrio marinus TaxID=370038 RepID=A0A6P1ZE18_9BACT|nr:cobalamin biosynthesis protein [Oceanidesulfovibrio marinus]TVM32803.1 cobalamin biosynthesis protein CbiG [Oceanidesulfovibrio marinus]